jgi:hypothetical protein
MQQNGLSYIQNLTEKAASSYELVAFLFLKSEVKIDEW